MVKSFNKRYSRKNKKHQRRKVSRKNNKIASKSLNRLRSKRQYRLHTRRTKKGGMRFLSFGRNKVLTKQLVKEKKKILC